jgi:hypothetical protein
MDLGARQGAQVTTYLIRIDVSIERVDPPLIDRQVTVGHSFVMPVPKD